MTTPTLGHHTYYSASEIAGMCTGSKRMGDGRYQCQCPIHKDNVSSLCVSDGNRGTVLKCQAGCDTRDIVAKLGIKMTHLFRESKRSQALAHYSPPPAMAQPSAPAPRKPATPEKPSDATTAIHPSLGKPEAVYTYNEEHGLTRYISARFSQPEKSFRQAQPDGRGGWQWTLNGVEPLIFRLEQIIEAVAQDKLIVIAEGEKDVLRLESEGFIATCNSGGAGPNKFPAMVAQYFLGAHVAILPDNDKVGRDHAYSIAELLKGIAASVKVVELEGLPEKGDVSDWLDSGRAGGELLSLIARAPAWGEKPRRIQLVDEEELNLLEDPGWLAKGVIPAGAYVTLFGESGSMKTFAALDLALSIALGLEWHGAEIKQGPVVYIVAEGLFGMKHRVAAWKKYHGVTGKLPIHFLKHGIAMTVNSGDLAELIAEIGDKVKPSPLLIVVDTLARNFVGNENATEDMNKYVAACDLLREATGATVLSVHHNGLSDPERGRGNTSNKGAVDTEMMASKDGYRVTLKCKKMKDAPEFAEFSFEALPVGKSLVLKPMDQSGGKLDGNRLHCLQAVHRAENGLTHGQWKKESALEKKNSSFNAAIRWLQDMAYVKKLPDRKYGITDAGKQAVSPPSIPSPSSVHPDWGQC